MLTKKEISGVFKDVRHDTDEYKQTVALRDEILRKPLNLEFCPQELAKEKDSFHLICRIDNILAACVVLKPLPDQRIRMHQLSVRKTLQGKGIGRSLVSYSETFAENHGNKEIILHARESAVGFYEKMGYIKEGSHFFEVTLPHYAMRKSLS
jgi:ribosomal protein S18 acetylase RimI-like enzyme